MAHRRTVCNLLSASRIVFLPCLYLMVHLGYHRLFWVSYILVGATDYFDGVAARRLNQVSEFGKELDSFADLLFYLSSAYFLNYLFPAVIAANRHYLIVFFMLLGFSFVLSAMLFGRPIMMHTFLLRLNAVLVFLVVATSFWFDTTLFVRMILLLYVIGFMEEIMIFIFFGNVDRDTKSILHLIRGKQVAV